MFSPADKSTACGMWSPTYILALALTLPFWVTEGIYRLARRRTRKEEYNCVHN